MSCTYFDVPLGAVIPIDFATYGKTNGESITLTGLAVTDIEIYKGTSVTQRASDAGYTLLDTDGIDIDGITGIHGFSIDTGDNTDSGFYAVGSYYRVVVSAVTIDSQTVNFVAARFRIVAAEAIAGKPKVDVDAWLGTAAATPSVNGVPEVDVTHWIGTAAATPTVAGVPEVDVTHWIGTAAATPTVAGVPEVDVTHLGGVAQSLADLKDFADTGYNPVTHYIAGIEGTLNQFDDLNNAVTAPTAAQNRAEMDSNSTQLAAIVDDTGTSGVVLANNAITAAKIAADAIGASELAADAAQEIADAILDRATAIEGYTPRQALRLILAALAAKLSGAATTTVAIRDIADTKDRITATVDADGNRTAVTLDAT